MHTWAQEQNRSRFNIDKDLLLAHYDCKTDVDDLHSAAALRTLLSRPEFRNVKYHVVAGAYGMQEGKYVPPKELFQLSFGTHWSDAHGNIQGALEEVTSIVLKTLQAGGATWIAEAGQSDFSARMIKSVQEGLPGKDISGLVHVVQHSDWNEKVTSPKSLQYVKANADYIKIPDGNAQGNGTPGFRSHKKINWKSKLTDPKIKAVWQMAIKLGNEFNGSEGRYNNEAIASGGLDFSDFSEIWWILELPAMANTEDFFSYMLK